MATGMTNVIETDSFPSIPPFPSNVPTAPLLRLSLSKLINNDVDQSARFFQVCKDLGFFYLDLRGVKEGEQILADAEKLFEVAEKVFDLDVEEKTQYDFSAEGSYFG